MSTTVLMLFVIIVIVVIVLIIRNSQKKGSKDYPYDSIQNGSVSSAPFANRYCGACGSEVAGVNIFCPACGSKLADQLQGSGQMPPYSAAPAYSRPAYGQDAPSAGFAVLGFFFPVIGLILYLVWREPLPLRARSAGKGAIIGVFIYVALVIIIAIAQVALLNSFFGLY